MAQEQIKQDAGKHFNFISSMFVALIMISNIVATKLISIGPFIYSGAIIIFPITYIFGDILTEVYGYSRSRRIIWNGFFALIFMSFVFWLVEMLPSAPFWQHQEAYKAILGFVPRIVFASILGYFAGEFSNSYVLSKLKILTKGRHLWVRTISSTILGEGVDTIIFATVAFYGIIPGIALVTAIILGYLFKVIYEVAATPITYRIVKYLKRSEGIDYYDYGTKYNPFKIR